MASPGNDLEGAIVLASKRPGRLEHSLFLTAPQIAPQSADCLKRRLVDPHDHPVHYAGSQTSAAAGTQCSTKHNKKAHHKVPETQATKYGRTQCSTPHNKKAHHKVTEPQVGKQQ